MSEKKKVENYSAAMVETLERGYDPAETEEIRNQQVLDLAETLERTPKSIRAKLVSMKVYKAKEYKGKTGAKPETKEDIVRVIAGIFGVDADATLPGLQNAGKNTLVFLRTFLQGLEQDKAE